MSTCNICYSEPQKFTHSCGRGVCKTCAESQLKRYVFPTKCPCCNNAIDRSFLQALSPPDLERYERVELLATLQLMKDVQFCANPLGCGNAMITVPNCSKMICSSCDFETCTLCSMEWHESMTCYSYKIFKEKNNDAFRAYAQCIQSLKCRKCPSCSSLTERSEGCNHMTCRCGKQYCFVCGQDFTDKHYECKAKLPPAPPVPEELRAWKLKMPIPESVLSPPPKPVVRRMPQKRAVPPPRPTPLTPLVPPVIPEGKQEEVKPVDEWVEVKKERKEKKPKDVKEASYQKKRRPKRFFNSGIVVNE